MLKPNFLLIGAQKSATTSISVMLSNHPDVVVVKGKEPHFFSENREYARGWEWYMSLFPHYNGERAIVDASTSYSRARAFPNTIYRVLLSMFRTQKSFTRSVIPLTEWNRLTLSG